VAPKLAFILLGHSTPKNHTEKMLKMIQSFDNSSRFELPRVLSSVCIEHSAFVCLSSASSFFSLSTMLIVNDDDDG
jgi:hypothetical protein